MADTPATDFTYLDSAATSWPKPPAVIKAVSDYLSDCAGNPGRGGHRLATAAAATVAEARLRLARFVGAPAVERVIFTASCTDAINMVLKGLLRREGEAASGGRAPVVISGLEHNAVTRPLRALERDGHVRVFVARPPADTGIVPLETWQSVIAQARNPTGRVALIVCTHASNVAGTIQPVADIAAIAHAHNAPILVDAAQTAGHVPIDVARDGIDFLALSGHKGLLGPQGLGALVLCEEVDLPPWREGGTGGDSRSPTQPDEYPFHLEAGTPNTPAMAGLVAALTWIEKRGVGPIHVHEAKLVDRLLDYLIPQSHRFTVPAANTRGVKRAGVVAFGMIGMPSEDLAAVLDSSFGIAGRAGLHCAPLAHEQFGTLNDGLMRVSTGPFTTEAEIDRLIAALNEIKP